MRHDPVRAEPTVPPSTKPRIPRSAWLPKLSLGPKSKMRRVRSRPRLSSFDAFDAVSVVSDDSDDDRRHKKDSRARPSRVRSKDQPPSPLTWLSRLPDHVAVYVSSFLSPEDTNAWMQTSRSYQDILSVPFVWRTFMERQWPFLGDCGDVRIKNQLRDGRNASIYETPLLLRLGCSQQSTRIDESTFGYTRVIRRFARDGVFSSSIQLRPTHVTPGEPILQTRSLTDGSKAVQYTGPIGHGDRSIRANQPLARPTELLHPRRRRRFSLRATICRTLCLHEDCAWRPFTSPFVERDGSINLTPRLVSYYEVSILSELESADTMTVSGHEVMGPTRGVSSAQTEECVAVGLAGCRFYCTSRMPGWDRHSFGYHGDDGGFFHGSGSMRKQYGPKFGRGDVIGCGVDYGNNTIFFTLNGVSLGTAMEYVFDDAVEHVGLYPVVGLDSSSLVRCNFLGPFEFDLSAYMHQQATTVLSALGQKKVMG